MENVAHSRLNLRCTITERWRWRCIVIGRMNIRIGGRGGSIWGIHIVIVVIVD